MTEHDTAPPNNTFGLRAALNIVLLLLVVGQVVFLAGRYRVSGDLTKDQLYTMTDTSLNILGKLEDRLLIECYFSDESRLPAYYRPARRTLTNFLAEYEKLGDGKITIQYFDPHDDNLLREKATRLGIVPQTVSDAGEASYTIKEVWQGVRLLYGADKQRVLPYLQPQAATFAYEAILIPLIKDLTILEKPKFALLAFGTDRDVAAMKLDKGQPPPMWGFSRLQEFVASRYALETITLDKGQLVPDQYERLVLIRPKRLTDRQKYALDQFLMRGGTLVVFADTAEVQIGKHRAMVTQWIRYDSLDSETKLLDQLAHYGAEVEERMVVDCYKDVSIPFSVPVQTNRGRAFQNFPYPYWLGAKNLDYAKQAAEIAATTAAPNAADPQLVAQYAKVFKPGVNVEHDLFKGFQEGQAAPTMFWPCGVDLADELPEGVVGETVLRTSPLAYAERNTTGHVHPLDQHSDPRKWREAYTKFAENVQRKLRSEPRQQFGLMVTLEGTFPSFFSADKIPPKPGEESAPLPQKEEAKDPLDDPLGEGDKTGEADENAGAQVAGPPSGSQARAAKAAAEHLSKAPPSAKLIVVADSDFIRNDLITGEHAQAGGPVSQLGFAFFLNVLDWLVQDRDLLALRNKTITVPRVEFAERQLGQGADEAAFESAVRFREKAFQWMNVIVPGGAMLLLWLAVALRQRARKKAFVTSVGN